MQRLLEDAEKLSGIEYDISSYADIVDAIHVVQTEMGITGTTAEEAASTIQGSVSMMKSSWTNLVTGIADENANLDVLIANFVDSVGTVAQNIVPKIGVALNSASKLISDLIPVIVQEIPVFIEENLPILAEAAISIIQSLVNGISENQEMLMETAFETITFLANSFITMLPQIVQLGLDLIVSLANGIAESLPELIPTIIDVVLKIVDTLTDPETLSQLLDAALTLILALAEGLLSEDSINGIVDSVFLLIDNLVTFLTDPENIMKLVGAAIRLVVAIAKGLISAAWRIKEKAGELIDKFKTKFEETDWVQLGKDIVNYIKDGIVAIAENARTWGKDLIDNFIGGIKEKWRNLKKTVSDIAQTVKDYLGFSEPKKGPLSNFHTYAPDMIDLFVKGIRDNESKLTDQIEKTFDFGERTIAAGIDYGHYGKGESFGTGSYGKNVSVIQNIYSEAKTAADLMQEAIYQQEKAVYLGV